MFYFVFITCVVLFFSTKPVERSKDNKDKEGIIEISKIDEESVREEAEPDESPEVLHGYYINEIIFGMSLEEKIGQLFMITPEALTGYATVTQAGEVTKSAFQKRPVGGIILFAKNIENPEQLQVMNQNLHNFSIERTGIPLWVGIDEEGGKVARIAGNPNFDVEQFPSAKVMAERNEEEVFRQGESIGRYLSEYGFDVNFAPIADVVLEPENQVIGDRGYGDNPKMVAKYAVAYINGLHEKNVLGCFKHFPGHGATVADSHDGSAETLASFDEMWESELMPFREGIENGVQVIMVGHIGTPNIEESGSVPASLSHYMITEVLREKMQFEGVVITDAMNMGAISQHYTSAEAAVKAIEAGVDIVLMPADFESAFQGVYSAVEEGKITEERIDESVRRILKIKIKDSKEKVR
jgi:beta-N-acetylhexosaminidase